MALVMYMLNKFRFGLNVYRNERSPEPENTIIRALDFVMHQNGGIAFNSIDIVYRFNAYLVYNAIWSSQIDIWTELDMKHATQCNWYGSATLIPFVLLLYFVNNLIRGYSMESSGMLSETRISENEVEIEKWENTSQEARFQFFKELNIQHIIKIGQTFRCRNTISG